MKKNKEHLYINKVGGSPQVVKLPEKSVGQVGVLGLWMLAIIFHVLPQALNGLTSKLLQNPYYYLGFA